MVDIKCPNDVPIGSTLKPERPDLEELDPFASDWLLTGAFSPTFSTFPHPTTFATEPDGANTQ